MKLNEMIGRVKIPEGINVEIAGHTLKVKGPKGELERKFASPRIKIENKEGKIILSALKATKREKTMMGTFKAHIKNMMKGAKESHTYRLKICTGHFPMNVSVSGNEFNVANFLGEKTPRKLKIKDGVKVKVEGEFVVVEGIRKEDAGQVAANIEILTKVKGRDRRIFQDGIYIIEKDGKQMG